MARRLAFAAGLSLALALVVASGCSDKRIPTTLPPAHPAEWQVPASADFHGKVVVQRGPASCQVCHGVDYTGGKVGVSCVECHLQSSGVCLSCHGGADNASAAPPLGLRGETDDTTRAVGAHTTHLEGDQISDGVPCASCHIVPAFLFDSLHLDIASGPTPDSIAEIVWGDIAPAPGAAWNRGAARCTNTYCHGNFSGGETGNAPVWTGGASEADCGSCHDVGADPAALLWKHEFHLTFAGLFCADCHASVVDTELVITALDLHVNGVADTLTRDPAICALCHGQGANVCTVCHGGTDNLTGAPPVGLRGETLVTELAVGAHSAHVQGGMLADAFDCTECHVKPDSMLQPGHLGADSVAEITWGGIAPAAGINWNRGAASCTNTYCHGNFTGGETANAPVWTGGAGQASCGSCHDVGGNPDKLGWKHEYHVGQGLRCADCHAGVVDTLDHVTDLTRHVNGIVDTLTRDAAVCQTCHGGAPSTCVYCHGGTDNLTGAPPLGLRDEVASSTLAVGAHSAHVENGALADAFDCTECHLKPSDITTPGHYGVDSIAEITWGGIAPAPGISWNRGAATCANTYCHGNFPNGFSGNTPVWTAGGGQAACGSCHDVGNDPKQLSGRHEKHVTDKGYACAACHAGTVNLSLNIVGPDLHVNDSVEVIFGTGQGNWDGTDCTNVGCHGRESWR